MTFLHFLLAAKTFDISYLLSLIQAMAFPSLDNCFYLNIILLEPEFILHDAVNILHVATETLCSQINSCFFFKCI